MSRREGENIKDVVWVESQMKWTVVLLDGD